MSGTRSLPKPLPFLTVRCHKADITPSVCGLCVGYERNTWRASQLADHIVSWLPEFALSSRELATFNHANSVDLIRRAAQVVYNTDKFKKRGEFGELFLHAAIRQVHDSIPAISKIFYKSAANDTVKGFDAIHVVGPPDDMELWLGEAKFYDNVKAAIRDVTKEVHAHLQTDYLRDEFLLVSNKLDDGWPHTPKLRQLLARETSLDEVFSRACIPVLLTYNSQCAAEYNCCSAEYEAAFNAEVLRHYADFTNALVANRVPAEVRVHLFLMPLNKKSDLVVALDRKLKAWQKI